MEQVQKYSNISVCMTASKYIDENGRILPQEANYWERISQLYLLVDFREKLMRNIICIGTIVLSMLVEFCFVVLSY